MSMPSVCAVLAATLSLFPAGPGRPELRPITRLPWQILVAFELYVFVVAEMGPQALPNRRCRR